MKNTVLRLVCLFFGFTLSLSTAHALTPTFTNVHVELVDRASGRVLPTRWHAGEWWVEGTPNARYGVRVKNQARTRVLAVISVDGVNVLTGETAGANQRGYVWNPMQSADINGWRKSAHEIAAFTFADATDAYASQTGRPDHVGVIGVALFPERERFEQNSISYLQEKSPAPRAASADAARASPFASPSPALGTAHGEREASYSETVAFERASDTPARVIRIRYDSRANLIARGVIVAPTGLPESRLNPFPSTPSAGYVPDPPTMR